MAVVKQWALFIPHEMWEDGATGHGYLFVLMGEGTVTWQLLKGGAAAWMS